MATTILTRTDEIENGLACGVGRTREIADQRAIAMYIERHMGIRTQTGKPDEIQARADVQSDIDSGDLVLVRF